MEKSKRSEATLTARMNHEDVVHGMNGDSHLSQTVCLRPNKENIQGTMLLTVCQGRETTKNEGSSMS